MRLLVLCTCLEVTSNLPQGCAPPPKKNYAILLFADILRLPYLVAVHSALSLNGGIVTLIARFLHVGTRLEIIDPYWANFFRGKIALRIFI